MSIIIIIHPKVVNLLCMWRIRLQVTKNLVTALVLHLKRGAMKDREEQDHDKLGKGEKLSTKAQEVKLREKDFVFFLFAE